MSKVKQNKSKVKSVTYESNRIVLQDGVLAEGDLGGEFTSSLHRGGNDTFIGGEGFCNLAIGEVAGTMTGGSRGGDDTFRGGLNGINVFVGDALCLTGAGTTGGNDKFKGGDARGAGEFAINIAVGDALAIAPVQSAIADPSSLSVVGSLASIASTTPSALGSVEGGARGGNDELRGGGASDCAGVLNVLVGDAGVLAAANGGNDKISVRDVNGTALSVNVLIGDSLAILGGGRGGNDEIEGGSVDDHDDDNTAPVNPNTVQIGAAINVIVGDALVISDSTAGKDDIEGGDGVLPENFDLGDLQNVLATTTSVEDAESAQFGLAINVAFGDALLACGTTTTGNDEIEGGDVAINVLIGDALASGPDTTLGNDELEGGDIAINVLIGDSLLHDLGAVTPTSSSAPSPSDKPFGDDTLEGGNTAINVLIGDALFVSAPITDGGSIQGPPTPSASLFGDDVLISGKNGIDVMLGDALAGDLTMENLGSIDLSQFAGLVNGASLGATDVDPTVGGADRFVFARDNGTDFILDLRDTDGDKIDLRAFMLDANSDGIEDTLSAQQVSALLDEIIVDDGGTAKIDFSLATGYDMGSGTITICGWTESELEAAKDDVFLV